ncbi:FAD-binding protein [Aeromicrobium camelliae]|uniref:FAD-binding protein n=1 Tax=Aeromicrobium camelliae TaxID=1538144 RepID=A0A3N6YXP1_9ACTN|nr:FAD-linked oxidase C-terminal domain-containing protein [Aeromicrobium camelliae]RQN02531.1 FAD-binding protein [Aeromicrobium camelliae]
MDTALPLSFRDLPQGVVIDDPDLLPSYARDQSRFTDSTTPIAVLAPRTTDEVAACVRACHEAKLAVVTRGAGTGLSGGANAVENGVVLSLHRMNQILSIDPVERLAVVQPGVNTAELRAAVAEQGLMYPPDPGSVASCSIGGNVATNAGGMCCVKYGVTRDFVEELEVVLADGRVMRTGTRTVKGVAGYDLTSLFVGSEGTLGVVTEIVVRLVPAPRPPLTLVATFDDLASAGAAVSAITAAGLALSAVEILDRTTLQAVDAMTHMGLGDAAAMLLVQADSDDAASLLVEVEKLAAAAGAVDIAVSEDPEEAAMLMEARRLALPALERLGEWLLDDVCVPRSRVVELIAAVEDIAADTGLTIGVFGHAGDGNLHPTLIFDEASRDAALKAFDRITEAALALGGTITGEHGVGRLKADWLTRELDPVALELQRALRRTFDPEGLLNPGAQL